MIMKTISNATILLFSFCCGAIVANIYYAQPIIDLIATDIGLSAHAASFIVSLTQIGYALGLFFLVPLGDLLENRRLMICTLLVSIISLTIAAFTHNVYLFLFISLMIGLSSVSVQMLIPLAAHLADENSRGRVVGTIMGGLLIGILLSRPLSSFVADHWGWRTVFGGAAILMIGMSILLAVTLSKRQPVQTASYFGLLKSLRTLFMTTAVLRQRSFYQACMFASFSLFWTAVALELAQQHGFTQTQIAIFALVGAAGAISAPISGRLADRGYTVRATRVALTLAAISFIPSLISPSNNVIGLAVTAILLDFSVQMNMVLGQREIYALDAANRSRLNGLYMTTIFLGGAVGSAIASSVYNHGGWLWVVVLGSVFPMIALILHSARIANQTHEYFNS